MDIQFEKAIAEIVQKADERYKLRTFELITSKSIVINELCQNETLQQAYISDNYPEFRALVSKALENHLKINQLNSNKNLFFDWLYSLYKQTLEEFRRSAAKDNQLLDTEIHTSPNTISFKDSKQILTEIIEDQTGMPELKSPLSIELWLRKNCKYKYPVTIDLLMEYLKKEDEAFWKELSIVTYKITNQIVRFSKLQKADSDDMQTEVWLSSENNIRKYILSEENDTFENGTHLRNFIRKTCKFSSSNYLRKIWNYSDKHIFLDLWKENNINLAFEDHGSNHIYWNIDFENESEVQQALVSILYLEEKPMYEIITSGIEDKVDMFLHKHIDNLSYDEIVTKMYGDNFSETERQKLNEKCRQIVCRTKNALIESFRKYIKSQQTFKN